MSIMFYVCLFVAILSTFFNLTRMKYGGTICLYDRYMLLMSASIVGCVFFMLEK